MKGNAHYIPASSPTVCYNHIKQLGEQKAKRMWWWKEEGFFQYDYMLFSVFYCMYDKFKNGQGPNIRQYLGIPDHIKLYGDSGGWQSQTQNKYVPNEDILAWYEKNCDYAFVQDFPKAYCELPAKEQDWNNFDAFKRCAEFQRESNKDYLKAKLTKCKLYNILHGENVQQMDHWFDAVKNDKMYGWASGQKPTEPFRIAFKLAYFYHKNVRKNIHIFAASGTTTIPLLVYASKYIDNITFDSSSWATGEMYRAYLSPLDISKKLCIGRMASAKYTTKLPCDCPVCRSITKMSIMYNNKAIPGNLLSLHNLYWLIWYTERYKDLLEVEEDFRSAVGHQTKGRDGESEVLHAMDYLDLAIKDFDKANSKYWRQLQEKRSLFQDEGQREDLEQSFFDMKIGDNDEVLEDKEETPKQKKVKQEAIMEDL